MPLRLGIEKKIQKGLLRPFLPNLEDWSSSPLA